jgi:hypothetical protein
MSLADGPRVHDKGRVDLKGVFGALADVSFDGWAVVELDSVPDNARTPKEAGAVNKIMLSPEGNTFAEMRALTRALVARGCRTFTLSFHSPSVEPGHTPYVRSETELRTFLADLERFCEFFFAEIGGQTSTLVAFRSQAEPWLRMTA